MNQFEYVWSMRVVPKDTNPGDVSPSYYLKRENAERAALAYREAIECLRYDCYTMYGYEGGVIFIDRHLLMD